MAWPMELGMISAPRYNTNVKRYDAWRVLMHIFVPQANISNISCFS